VLNQYATEFVEITYSTGISPMKTQNSQKGALWMF